MKKIKIIKNFTAILLSAALLVSLFACTASPVAQTPVTKNGFYFDTIITITLYGSDKEKYIDDCFGIAQKYENLLSASLPDSDVSRINSAKGSAVSVSDDTIAVLSLAKQYAKLSEGLFDPSVGELTSLWDFHSEGSEEGKVPDQKKIKKAIKTIDYNNIIINGNTVALKSGRLDLGGIAKGYIADRMKEYLSENGIDCGIINLGGNILLLGPKPNGDEYTVAIQKPFSEEGTPAFTIKRSGCSIVTSGTYERFFLVDGRLYHHILDPRTGYPADNGISSLTVITEGSADADALSTTLFLLGSEYAINYANENEDVDVIIIDDQGNITSTTDIKKSLTSGN